MVISFNTRAARSSGERLRIHPGARRRVVFGTHLRGNREQRKTEERNAERQ